MEHNNNCILIICDLEKSYASVIMHERFYYRVYLTMPKGLRLVFERIRKIVSRKYPNRWTFCYLPYLQLTIHSE